MDKVTFGALSNIKVCFLSTGLIASWKAHQACEPVYPWDLSVSHILHVWLGPLVLGLPFSPSSLGLLCHLQPLPTLLHAEEMRPERSRPGLCWSQTQANSLKKSHMRDPEARGTHLSVTPLLVPASAPCLPEKLSQFSAVLRLQDFLLGWPGAENTRGN